MSIMDSEKLSSPVESSKTFIVIFLSCLFCIILKDILTLLTIIVTDCWMLLTS